MNTILKKTAQSLAMLLTIGITSPVHANILNETYSFGTNPGRTTLTDAGFTEVESGDAMFTDQPEGVLLDRIPGTGSFQNAGFLQTFTGLGSGQTNNFTLSTTFTITAWDVANVNNDRFGGLHLFADTADSAGIDATGISATLLGDSGTNNDDIVIRTGINSTTLSSADLGYDFELNDVFQLDVEGTFSGSTFNLDFHVSRNGGPAQTISTSLDTVVDAAILDGTFFGVSTRIKDSTGTTFDSFSVNVIPEPSTLALLGAAAGMLHLLRRRRT
jgi:hypothetical protein